MNKKDFEAPVLNHWIAGTHTPPSAGTYFPVLTPLDDSLYAQAARGNKADIVSAVETAQQAFESYSQTLPRQREEWLIRAADLVVRDQAELVELLIDEIGSPISKARFEVDFAVRMLRAAAGVSRRVTGQTIPSDRTGAFSMSVREPVGVVAGITPFNVPLVKAVKQSAVALAVGNSFVLLPSEEAPRIALRYASLLHEAGLPEGVFNVVTGIGHEIGDFLSGHPLVKCICFCGSTRVGQHIAELAAKSFKKTALELGGKSPMVVLNDADVDKAVDAAIAGIFFFQGQACMGTSRIILQQGIAQQFKTKFRTVAQSMKFGDLRDPQTAIGPIISERQRTRVRTHIKDAKQKGATLEAGGDWEGNCCQPTIFSEVTRDMLLFAEETFGPVTALYTVDTIEEAIALANDTKYGLSASVFTNDLNSAMRLSSEIRAGMVHVNAASLQDEPHVPFGGTGISGYGREGTETDIELMTEWKWITIQLPVA